LAKTKTIENLFNYLASYSAFLPVIFFLLFRKKCRKERVLWIILIYSIYNYLTDIGLLYLNHNPSRIFLYSSFTFFEYSLFASIFYLVIKKNSFKKFIIAASILFSIFIISYNLYVKIKFLDSIPIGVEAILILIFSFYYLYEQMQDAENLFVYSRYLFWIVLGMMLYLAGSFFIYIYTSQLPPSQIAHYWIFTNIFSILKNVFFSLGIIVYKSQATKQNIRQYNLSLLN
jgi:hypothetical protein